MDWEQTRDRLAKAIERAGDWDDADHYEDCPAIPHVDHECDCPVIEGDDDDTADECSDRCADKADEVCDCYLGVMRDLRSGGRAALERAERPLDVEHTTSCGHTWTMRHTACPECFAALHQRVKEFQEHERQTHERLGAILGTDDSLEACAKRLRQRVGELEQTAARIASEAACERLRAEAAEAEVARLEGVILGWADGSGSGCDVEIAFEARRIREETPLRVEDVLDGLPRLSTEAEALRVMGAGQRLVKMREIKPEGPSTEDAR